MKIPVVAGDGRYLELDSDGMPRLIVAEACDEIDPRLWELFSSGEESGRARGPGDRSTSPVSRPTLR